MIRISFPSLSHETVTWKWNNPIGRGRKLTIWLVARDDPPSRWLMFKNVLFVSFPPSGHPLNLVALLRMFARLLPGTPKDDSKSLYRKWLFHQTTIFKLGCLGFQVSKNYTFPRPFLQEIHPQPWPRIRNWDEMDPRPLQPLITNCQQDVPGKPPFDH